MSRIWFYDESLKQYFEIPIVNAVFPGASVSEYVRAKRQAIKEGRDAEDIETINRMIRENREQEQASALKPKAPAETSRNGRTTRRKLHQPHRSQCPINQGNETSAGSIAARIATAGFG